MVSVWKTPHCASRQCQIRAVKLWRTYRNTEENLSDEERLDILGSEEDGGEAHEQGETADDGPTVTKLLGDPAVDEETDDGIAPGKIRRTPGNGGPEHDIVLTAV